MKIAVAVLSVIALTCAVPVGRDKRSVGHFGGPVSYYSAPIASYYSEPSYVAPVYTYPESTRVSTLSSTQYKVHVPVTYTYTYQQPVHSHSTVYHHTPAVHGWADDPWC